MARPRQHQGLPWAPSSYTDDVPEIVYNLMRQGKSVVQVCSHLDICRDTFYDWVKKYPILSDAFRAAKEKCESHWEDWLQSNFTNKEVNGVLVKMFFANRFEWRDRKETEHSGSVGLRQEDVLKDLG